MYERLQSDIETLSKHILDWIEVERAENIEAASVISDEVATDMDRLMQAEAYKHHLIEYLKTEKTRFDAREREEPMCTCGDPYCCLKRGTLPPSVRRAESLEKGITEYQLGHSGEPRVLLDAREEWLETGRRVRRKLKEALVELRKEDVEGVEDDQKTREATA
ncbi:hypothetical protein C2R22_24545 (plasmid) [Salinigranum rubrum]|uniref:Uncharacterized protein n=1 Tax=Salinigranum rubrum TaxID=755307 RepID=A0A2I8VS01_9EURY|nr:hypothetical protein [Salinigranum rubrum]AUV84701.1 hypothetical protein C2R22_24545 [Salinigranum rubrum]